MAKLIKLDSAHSARVLHQESRTFIEIVHHLQNFPDELAAILTVDTKEEKYRLAQALAKMSKKVREGMKSE